MWSPVPVVAVRSGPPLCHSGQVADSDLDPALDDAVAGIADLDDVPVAEHVARFDARSREHAGQLIADGRVSVAGAVAQKAATGVSTDAAVQVTEAGGPEWASRGAHKLLGALAAFTPQGLVVSGRRCLDAGASTGGFTDVLLHGGAAHVVAVDVGYGQLAWRLRTDERVTVHDRINVRTLTAAQLGGPVELIVADLSFISLRLVLPALVACAADGADLLPMVKPQFEVGKQVLSHGMMPILEPEVNIKSETRALWVSRPCAISASSGWVQAAWCVTPRTASQPCCRWPTRPASWAGACEPLSRARCPAHRAMSSTSSG